MAKSYKRNEVTGNKVNCCMKNEELESHAAQMKQTGFSGFCGSTFIRIY